MNPSNNFELIKGVFEAEDAKDILLCLVDRKIQFHTHKIFSEEERFGTKNLHSINRIKELKEARNQILALTNECSQKNSQLTIHSQIQVEITAQEEVA